MILVSDLWGVLDNGFIDLDNKSQDPVFYELRLAMVVHYMAGY